MRKKENLCTSYETGRQETQHIHKKQMTKQKIDCRINMKSMK